CAGRGRSFLSVRDRDQLGDFTRAHCPCREPHNLGFENETNLESADDSVESERSDKEPAVCLKLDDEFAGEAPQRFANRRARDAKRLSQLSLTEPRSGR